MLRERKRSKRAASSTSAPVRLSVSGPPRGSKPACLQMRPQAGRNRNDNRNDNRNTNLIAHSITYHQLRAPIDAQPQRGASMENAIEDGKRSLRAAERPEE